MGNKTKYVLIVIVLILVIAVFAYQQKTIMGLNSKVDNLDGANMKNHQSVAKDPFLAEAVQKIIKENTKELKGSLISKDQGSIVIEADVVDFPKLSGLSDATLKQTDSLPTIKKKFTIAINADTEMPLKLEDTRIGSMVHVFTDNLVYGDGQLTAKKFWVLSSPGVKNRPASVEGPISPPN
jgi:hypothetical protein